MQDTLDVEQVCSRAGLSQRRIQELVKEGTFPRPTRAGQVPFWQSADVDAWLEKPRPGKPDPAAVAAAVNSSRDPIDYDRLAGMVAARLGPARPLLQPGPKPPLRAGIHVSPVLHERIVWLSDLHVPYHDVDAVNAALSFCEDWRPNLIIVGGDLFDAYLISSYGKDPTRLRSTMQAEFDAGQPIVRRIEALGSEVVFILGNHCARMNAVIAGCPGLAELRVFDWHVMADLPARWIILPQHSRYRVGHLDFHHGDLKKGPGGRYVGARMLEDLKRSSVFGHFHRSQMYAEPDGDGIMRAGFSSGHLCDEDEAAKYCPIQRWTKGFRSIDMDPTTGLFEVRAHLFHAGGTRINGKTYGG